ncbi:MAG: DsrE/DsrF/TusD sulfur relay family protein [Promethearchaeota archaeon]
MTSYTLMICSEPYKYEAMDSLLNLAKAIIEKGNTITGIFLYGSGVYNIKKDIETGRNLRNLPQKLSDFVKEHNIPVAGCTTWVGLVGVKPDTFIDGGEEQGLGDLSNWTGDSDKLIVFGAGA